ncbi:hypothetical protein F0562_015813 [Nyssa sinensis]|uniref:Uncharacterized protein n=1 Tax=Nyssa sinensis TaxID=561372 RepID=A0A5J4ZKF7_9ASTE|nr:hypothetical protein F0562_015813 [Nyssa sinensis]
MKMKMSCTLPPLLLLLIVSSVEFNAASAVHEAHAIRIPEHTCRKLIGSGKCNWQKCIQDCYLMAWEKAKAPFASAHIIVSNLHSNIHTYIYIYISY